MAVSGNVATKKVTSEPIVTRSDKKTVIVSSEPSVTYRYRLKEQPTEPEQPSTPVVPDIPSEPDQPATPVVPDTPSEPSQPTNPEVPVNPSTSNTPDTTDTTNPNSPGTDTNVVTPSDEQLPMVLGETRANETSENLGKDERAVTGNGQRMSPQTGDDSNIALWGSLAAESLSALGFALMKRRHF